MVVKIAKHYEFFICSSQLNPAPIPLFHHYPCFDWIVYTGGHTFFYLANVSCCIKLTLLSNFASNFHAAVDGRGSSPDGIEMNELYGGARIR